MAPAPPSASEAHAHVVVPTRFLWRYGGSRYHQYKFIVDGEWRHDESQAFMPDPLGNVNNWLFIRRPENTR
eukprot:jgi/Pico_ML_1/53245/g3821.t1